MYNMYNLYINTCVHRVQPVQFVHMEYNLSEFRKNTRDAFNRAEAGEDVVVERYGLRYRLTRASDLPNSTVSVGTALPAPSGPTIRSLADLLKENHMREVEDDGPDMSMYKWDPILGKAFNTQTEEYEAAKLVNGKIVLL